MTKKEIKTLFKTKLSADVNWAVKGMLRIYSFQTASEQASKITREDNNVGFSGCDAEIMSSFSEQVLNGRILSEKQMAIVFKKMPKYWAQLVSLSNMEKVESMTNKAA